MKLEDGYYRTTTEYHWTCSMCHWHTWQYSKTLLEESVEKHNHPVKSPLREVPK